MVFYRRHLCRLDPWPEAMQRTADELDGNQVYLTMNGPTEFDVIGEACALGPHRRPRAHHEPHARHLRPLRRDHAGLLRDARGGHPGARMVVFESSAHCAHLEETPRYTAEVGGASSTSGGGDQRI